MREIELLMPADKVRLLEELLENLGDLPNLTAAVLGGSHAYGFARADSDLDIGLYYHAASPFSIDDVRSIAERICTPGSMPVLTEMYDWGPWVNEGAWIQTRAGKVDFLYRNLDQVQKVIEEGHRGGAPSSVSCLAAASEKEGMYTTRPDA